MKTPLSSRCKAIASMWLAVGCLTSVIAPAAYASLINNGSFEGPDLGPGVHLNVAAPTGWSGTGNNYGIINSSGGSLGSYPAAQNGNQYLYTSAAHVTQGFSIDTPGDYLLTWFDNTWVGGGNESYRVQVDNSLATVAQQAFSINYGPGGAWHQRSLNLTGLATGNYSLSLGFSTTGTFFDNVSLDAVAVPEPTTMIAGVLLLLPFGVSTLRALRQRRHSAGGLSRE